MSRVFEDLRFAARSLAKRPGYAVLAIATIAIGIGAATAVFSVVNTVLLEPLPFGQPDRLVAVSSTNLEKGIEGAGVSAPDVLDYRRRMTTLAGIEAWSWYGLSLNTDGRPRDITTLRVTPGTIDLFQVAPLSGRTFRAGEREEDRVVLLSWGMWQSEFGGDPGIVGKQIRLEEAPWTVVGVMPDSFAFPSREVKMWIPQDPTADTRRAGRFLGGLARLGPGVSLERAQREADTVAGALASEYPDTNKGFRLRLTPLQESVVGGVRKNLFLALGAVGLLLLVGCTNVTNLMLARGLARRPELAARVALGAGRGRLLSLMLAESTLIAVAGGALGILLAAWGTEILAAANPADLPRAAEVGLDGRALGVSIVLILLAGPVFGLLPAWQLAGSAPSAALRAGGRGSVGSAARSRRWLTVAELAMALVLLVGAGLMIKSLWRLNAQDPGFRPQGALALQLFVFGDQYREPAAWRLFYEQLESRLAALPGVASVGAMNTLPLSVIQGGTLSVQVDGRAEAEKDRAAIKTATPGFLPALGRRLVSGRAFTAADRPESQPVAMLNETAARRFFPEGNALGQRVKHEADPRWWTVVGVVADMRQEGLEVAPRPELVTPFAQRPGGMMSVVVRAKGDAGALLEAAQQQVWQVDPVQPIFRAALLEDFARENTQRRRFLTWLVGVFAGLALALAAVGIYGVVSYGVAQQLREFALRLALGARPAQIRRLVLRDGFLLTVAGIGLGAVASLFLARGVASLLYEVDPADPPTFLLVGVGLAAISLLACLLPAQRAAAVAPFESLKEG
ncbi:MAG TPA: ABC transporter permease [Thermoanaerobaculia bacterium]|nr:ABC transporter permease [Thermoanaerobaculia bacterium]